MSRKHQLATNRPAAQPIEIELDARQRARILATARNIILARTPCTSLTQYLNTASERGLDRLCGRVSEILSGNDPIDATDVLAVLLQTERK
jgi:hypothetical protein